MLENIRVCVLVGLSFFFFFFLCAFSSMYVICLNMSIVTCYMFVYMYVQALTPPACGLSLICNKVLLCSLLYYAVLFIRRDQKLRRNDEACRASPTCF